MIELAANLANLTIRKPRFHGLVALVFALLVACAEQTPTVGVAPTSTVLPAANTVPPPTTGATGTPAPATQTPASAAGQFPAWFRDVVLYEIFPRSFYDSNGDGIGDLKGITTKLDYIEALGAGAVWLTPIFPSPSYHGYDTTDYYKINPEYGTEADLTELVREAHRRHIRVLLDYVVAHTSNEHPFFKDAYGNPNSKYAGWYRWTNPEHTSYESFAGVKEMPTLNHDNPEVQQYLIDVAKYWMKLGVDGYRADFVLNVPHEFWRKLRAELKPANPDFLLLAEAWTNARDIKPYYDAEFDATFDFPLYGDIEGNQSAVGDSFLLGTRSPGIMDGTLRAEQVLYPPGAERVIFLNNHDTARVMSEVKSDVKRAKAAAALLLTLPGTPLTYYGEEIGVTGVKGSDDKPLREPMDWYGAESGPGMTTWYKPPERNNKPNDGISVQEEQGRAESLLELYRTLIGLRNATPALKNGPFQPVQIDGDSSAVYAFVRGETQSPWLVVINFGSAAASVRLDLTNTTVPQTRYTGTDALTKRRFELAAPAFGMQLDPVTAYILELVPQ